MYLRLMSKRFGLLALPLLQHNRQALCTRCVLRGLSLPRRSIWGAAFAMSSFSISAGHQSSQGSCSPKHPAVAMSSTAESSAGQLQVSLLTQAEAQAIDEELMSTPGFSVDQLMELAGLSVAQAVDDFLRQRKGPILIVCGPGNNGGDGQVAARHLYHFGYQPTVVYPKRSSKQLYENLVKQCSDLSIEVTNDLPTSLQNFDLIVDSMFGFGTKGQLRAPFGDIMQAIIQSRRPVLSVDIPSGWDVEEGDVHRTGLQPEALISLTAPKKCAVYFNGKHYLGGRFIPPQIVQKYQLRLPSYPGTSQFVALESRGSQQGSGGADVPEFIVVWVTAPSKDQANKLADGLISDRLAACVNIIPGVESVYEWKGKVERDEEVLMMAKTRSSVLPEFSDYVRKHHAYEVPETIAAGILGGSQPYLDWVRENTRGPAQQ